MNCPCGSETNYENCCEPVIRGKVKAPTAEALMRSRYAAFALAEVDHLRDSLAPESRTDFDPETTRQWAEKSKWLGLQIISTEKGKAEDAVGTVEFVAKYSVEGKTTEHREKSDFRKEDGTWYFVDGHIHTPGTLVREAPKTGRNDPCPCGSGKKFKKCCGT